MTSLLSLVPVKRPRRVVTAFLVSASVAIGLPSPAAADVAANVSSIAADELPSNGQLSHFNIDDADPSASLPDPKTAMADVMQLAYLLMDLSDRAERAMKVGDFPRAARYFKAIVKAAPDRAIGYSKLCESYIGMNELEKARAMCNEALFREGVTQNDFVRYLRLVLDTRKQLGPDDLQDLNAVFAHIDEKKIENQVLYQLKCEVATRVSNTPMLEECTKALAAKWPDDPTTITYEWSLALTKKDFAKADNLIQRARTTPMKPEGIQAMESATRAAQRKAWPKYLAAALGGLVLVLMGILAMRLMRQTRRPSSV